MAKRFKLQGIRIHQSYEVWEVTDLLGASEQTVRGWIRSGLPALSAKRPLLILGCELKVFLEKKQAKAKRKPALGEMMCMSCRRPQMPYGLMADYLPMNARTGRLEALCGVCEGVVMRFTSAASLPEFSKILQITQIEVGKPNGTNQPPAKT